MISSKKEVLIPSYMIVELERREIVVYIKPQIETFAKNDLCEMIMAAACSNGYTCACHHGGTNGNSGSTCNCHTGSANTGR